MNLKQILKLHNLPLLGSERLQFDGYYQDVTFAHFDIYFEDENGRSLWVPCKHGIKSSTWCVSYEQANAIFKQMKHTAHTAELISIYYHDNKRYYDNKISFAKFKGEWYVTRVEIL